MARCSPSRTQNGTRRLSRLLVIKFNAVVCHRHNARVEGKRRETLTSHVGAANDRQSQSSGKPHLESWNRALNIPASSLLDGPCAARAGLGRLLNRRLALLLRALRRAAKRRASSALLSSSSCRHLRSSAAAAARASSSACRTACASLSSCSSASLLSISIWLRKFSGSSRKASYSLHVMPSCQVEL